MTNLKEVKISEIFDTIKWKSLYTKTYINENMWVFPVFSSQTTNYWIVWNINIYDYSKDCITWTTDWIHAWTPFLRENCKFSMTTHCWALFLLDEFKEKIFLRYIFDYLKIYLKNYAIWTDNKRITSWMIKDVFIKIPINKDWEFDLEKQKEIAWKYEKLEKVKDRIRIMKEDIEQVWIKLKEIWNSKEILIWDKSYFNAFIGKRVLKKDLERLKGSDKAMIPLFSANVHIPFWFVEESNISNFSDDYVLWGIDGNFEFSIIRAWEVFASTDHCGCIKVLNKGIFPLYLLYKLNAVREEYAYSRTFRANLKNMSKIKVTIPVNEDGEFDLEKQKEVALKYERIEKIKNNLLQELEYLEKVKVEI